MIAIIYWVGTVLGIIGVTLVALKKAWAGHIVFVPANICIIIAAFANAQIPIVVLMSYYTVIAFVGCWVWRPIKLKCVEKWKQPKQKS
jgi:nicotinamide riboside transporter PnuC